MSTPATRGELKAELETFEQRLDAASLAALDAREQRLVAGLERIFKESLERLDTRLAAITARHADRRIDPDPEQGR